MNQYPKTLQSHTQALSLVGAVDIATSKLIFGEEHPEETTKVTISAIAEQLQGTDEVDVGQRAYDYLIDMVNSHTQNFEDGAKERWGFISENSVEFFPAILEKLLKEQGFHPKKVYASWEEKGLIKVTYEKDYKRYSFLKKKDGKVYRVAAIKLHVQEESKVT